MKTETFKPIDTASAAKWWTDKRGAGLIVYWDAVAKHMLATDDADLRNLPAKDISKVIRVRSESNIRNLLEGHWKSTPTVVGKVKYKGAIYVLSAIRTDKREQPLQDAIEKVVGDYSYKYSIERGSGANYAAYGISGPDQSKLELIRQKIKKIVKTWRVTSGVKGPGRTTLYYFTLKPIEEK